MISYISKNCHDKVRTTVKLGPRPPVCEHYIAKPVLCACRALYRYFCTYFFSFLIWLYTSDNWLTDIWSSEWKSDLGNLIFYNAVDWSKILSEVIFETASYRLQFRKTSSQINLKSRVWGNIEVFIGSFKISVKSSRSASSAHFFPFFLLCWISSESYESSIHLWVQLCLCWAASHSSREIGISMRLVAYHGV